MKNDLFAPNDIEIKKSAIDSSDANNWYNELLHTINWHKELRMVKTGEMAIIPRKMAYIADAPVMYRYDKYELPGDVWNDTLRKIKEEIEKNTEEKFNSVLLNLYEDGDDEIGWHSDKERQLGNSPTIACLNLGTGRKFSFKNKDHKEIREYFVENGDILIMNKECQRHWFHAILKDQTIKTPRISLTFRWVYPIDDSGIFLVNILSKPQPFYDLYIGRYNADLGLGGSKWSNPFRMKNESERPSVLEKYEEHIRNSPELIVALPELKNLTLGCYCAPDKICHGNILIKLYNEFVLNNKQ